MQSIYCCGNRGAVGFVRGWDFAETDAKRVVDVHLTLNLDDAYTFTGGDLNDKDHLDAVLSYLKANEEVYGRAEVLGREEP